MPLFLDVLLVCEEEGLLGGTVFALDGCKISSNASKQMEWHDRGFGEEEAEARGKEQDIRDRFFDSLLIYLF